MTTKDIILPHDAACEVIDLSGLSMPQDEYLPDDLARYTRLKKIVLHGCDRDTVAKVMIQCAYALGRLIEFEADLDWKRDTEVFLEPGDRGQQIFFPLSWDFNEHHDFSFQVYGDECYSNSFNEEFAVGRTISLVVHSPVCCRVGETFDVALPNRNGRWHYYDYATLLLQEILMQWGVAIVRVQVKYVGTYKDFLKQAAAVPEQYAYSPPDTGDEPSLIEHYDVEGGVTVVYTSSYGGDTYERHHIITIDGVDHLVSVEYSNFESDRIVFGDLVLGYHSQAPF